MKQAVLYARVSSDLQKREKTIDSQILELKRQITKAGDVLVKEYIDDGFSGARLDRPAMDELRKDLKSRLFETIYFLNADRIARDVTYQNIIVAEILKHGKQLIINGKDYVQNSENKFTLTVLGAVSELERAKISERIARGKALKLAQGCHPGRGCNLYGYDFIHKTPETKSASFVINEHEAEAVRIIFEEYAKGEISGRGIARVLTGLGYTTKTGLAHWEASVIKNMLKNHAYAGTVYVNKMKLVRDYADPLSGITKTVSRMTRRDKSEWVGLPVPAIISQELFDKVQERIIWNDNYYRGRTRIHLVSDLIFCSTCNNPYGAFKDVKKTISNFSGKILVREHSGYVCRKRREASSKCHTKQIQCELMENKIWEMVETILTNPEELRSKIPSLHRKAPAVRLQAKRRLVRIEKDLSSLAEKRKRTVDLYTNGDLYPGDYTKRIFECDKEIKILEIEKADVLQRMPVVYDEKAIDINIKSYSEDVLSEYQKLTDFDSKRKFCFRYFKKIIHDESDILTFIGSIPIQDKGNLEFRVKRMITQADRFKKRANLLAFPSQSVINKRYEERSPIR